MGREYRVLDHRLLTGERTQERNDGRLLGVGEIGAKLSRSHHVNGFAKIPNETAVEVWGRQLHVAERRRSEDIVVAL